jgi:Tfp pilus assembly protein PilO
MKKYLDQLQPNERRLVVAVMVVVVLVLNFMFIWPHFSDWGKLSGRLASARTKLKLYQSATNMIPGLQADVKQFESSGESVASEDLAIDLMRAIQAQAAAAGFGIQNFSRSITHTEDPFFVEQVQNITVLAKEDQLVNFLYKLGSSASMIRVRDLEMQPDPPHQRLNANIRLVASYQKSSGARPAKTSTAKAK